MRPKSLEDGRRLIFRTKRSAPSLGRGRSAFLSAFSARLNTILSAWPETPAPSSLRILSFSIDLSLVRFRSLPLGTIWPGCLTTGYTPVCQMESVLARNGGWLPVCQAPCAPCIPGRDGFRLLSGFGGTAVRPRRGIAKQGGRGGACRFARESCVNRHSSNNQGQNRQIAV